jgi:hypothetical protein
MQNQEREKIDMPLWLSKRNVGPAPKVTSNGSGYQQGSKQATNEPTILSNIKNKYTYMLHNIILNYFYLPCPNENDVASFVSESYGTPNFLFDDVINDLESGEKMRIIGVILFLVHFIIDSLFVILVGHVYDAADPTNHHTSSLYTCVTAVHNMGMDHRM